MDYFLQFHWWYLLVGLFFFVFLGKGKGGVVVKRYSATLEALDPRFEACRTKATYAIFKEGSPDHMEIEVEDLFLEAGEQLDFYINGKLLARVPVERDKEAEFDHWSDEDVHFPVITGGEELVIKYQGCDVFKGTFR